MNKSDRGEPFGHLWLVVLLSLVCAAHLTAQDELIRVSTRLVTLSASVMDRDGRYVSGLDVSQFHLLEDGKPQQIAFFRPVTTPFTVLLLLDRSASMTPDKPAMIGAANQFFSNLRPDDVVIAESFADDTMKIFGPKQVKDINKSFKVEPKLGDMTTRLFDAVHFALERMQKVKGRKAIVLFTDGMEPTKGLWDVGSIYATAKGTLKKAEEAETIVYTIKFNPLDRRPNVDREKLAVWNSDAREYMGDLARLTGGRFFEMENVTDLAKIFADIVSELGSQYTLGYYAAANTKAGERRKIAVKVDVPGAVVRSRKEVVY